MKKIAILKEHLGVKGGLENSTFKLIEAFEKKGCSVFTLTRETLNSGKLEKFDNACKKWLLKNSPDIIFGMERTTCHTHYRAGSGVHAAYLERRKLIDPFFKQLFCKIEPRHKTILSLEKKCFESPQLKTLFTNSLMVKEEILSYYKVDPRKIEIIYNGAPYTLWEEHFNASFTNSKNTFELLFIGNGFRRKGLAFLLDSLKLLNYNDLHLSIVGYDKELKTFQRKAKGLNVTFYGAQKNVIPFYKKADCLCIPSIYDPSANVTMEALAMGLFVISSRFNGGHEILTKESGITISKLGSKESLLEALKIAYDNPKTAISANRIRQTVKELDYSIQLGKMVDKTL